jgi:hypothetical protein
MRYRIVQHDLLSKEKRTMFVSGDFELIEMMFRDYTRQSSNHYAYEIIENLKEG